jgi:hypothetical protein
MLGGNRTTDDHVSDNGCSRRTATDEPTFDNRPANWPTNWPTNDFCRIFSRS